MSEPVYWHAARNPIEDTPFVLPLEQVPQAEPWVAPEDRQRAIECGSLQPLLAFVVDAAAWNHDVDRYVHSGLPFINPDKVWVYEVDPENLQDDQTSLDTSWGSKSCSKARIRRCIWPT